MQAAGRSGSVLVTEKFPEVLELLGLNLGSFWTEQDMLAAAAGLKIAKRIFLINFLFFFAVIHKTLINSSFFD